jgi:hypothetical protein
MNAESASEVDGEPAGKPTESKDTLINDVARTVGATLGTIAVGTAKLLGSARSKGSPAKRTVEGISSSHTEDVRFQKRRESYRKKKARHKQNLKRSRTKG